MHSPKPSTAAEKAHDARVINIENRTDAAWIAGAPALGGAPRRGCWRAGLAFLFGTAAKQRRLHGEDEHHKNKNALP